MARERFTAVVPDERGFDWVSLGRAKGRLEVLGQGRVEWPTPGTEALSSAELPPRGPVAVGIPSESLLMRVVELPDVPADELAGMARLQMDKVSPFPSESIVVGQEVLARDAGMCRVLIAGVRQDIVEAARERLLPLGLRPVRVDARTMGWWHGIHQRGGMKGRIVSLFVGAGIPELIVAQDGMPLFFRLLGESEGLEGDAFDEETARALAYTLVSVEMECGEAPYSVQVWHAGPPPESLRVRLAEECGCEVRTTPLRDLPGPAEGLTHRWAERGAEGLDLVPDAWRQAASSTALRRKMIVAGAAIIAAWILFTGALFLMPVAEGLRLSRLQKEGTEWQARGLAVREMRRKVHTIERYMDMTHSALECLREISVLIPEGVDLTSFTYRKGEELKVSGESMAVTEIYAFKNRVDESELFLNAVLNGPRRDPKRGRELFDIDIKLPGGEP